MNFLFQICLIAERTPGTNNPGANGNTGGHDDPTGFEPPPVIEADLNNTLVNVPVAGNILTNDNGGNTGDPVGVGDGNGGPFDPAR